VGSFDKKFYAINVKNGKTLWSKETGGAIYSSAAEAPGRIFVGSRDGRLYCFKSIGKKK